MSSRVHCGRLDNGVLQAVAFGIRRMVEGLWETRWNANIYLSKMALTPARALRLDFVSLSGAIFSMFRSSYTHGQHWLPGCAS